jgi:hypothetical protein
LTRSLECKSRSTPRTTPSVQTSPMATLKDQLTCLRWSKGSLNQRCCRRESWKDDSSNLPSSFDGFVGVFYLLIISYRIRKYEPASSPGTNVHQANMSRQTGHILYQLTTCWRPVRFEFMAREVDDIDATGSLYAIVAICEVMKE